MSDENKINSARTVEYPAFLEKSAPAFLCGTEVKEHPTILFDSFFEIKQHPIFLRS